MALKAKEMGVEEGPKGSVVRRFLMCMYNAFPITLSKALSHPDRIDRDALVPPIGDLWLRP